MKTLKLIKNHFLYNNTHMKSSFPSFENLLSNIFRRGSTTFFISSLFFSQKIRRKVSAFYAFVRIIDNMVDEKPVHPHAFYKAKQSFYDALAGKATQYLSIDNFAQLVKTCNINLSHIESFFDSMEWDLQPHFTIDSMEKCLWYIHGSAEVIGYMMLTLCEVDDEALLFHAGRLGRAMQYVNFMRDIAEDERKGRRYIPLLDTNLKDLSYESACTQYEEFSKFIRRELVRYMQWLDESAEGMKQLPPFIRTTLVTASDLYSATAYKIYKNPMRIFGKKINSNKCVALLTGIKNGVLRKSTPSLTMKHFSIR